MRIYCIWQKTSYYCQQMLNNYCYDSLIVYGISKTQYTVKRSTTKINVIVSISRKSAYLWMSCVGVGVARLRSHTVQCPYTTILQHMQRFFRNGDVSIWVKFLALKANPKNKRTNKKTNSINSDIYVTNNPVYPESYLGMVKFLDIVPIFRGWK